MTSQRVGKYACLELERRYLLARLPDGIEPRTRGWRILDQYWPGTRLRLRRMTSLADYSTTYKLTQKYRSVSQAAHEATITNMYLSEAEYNLLSGLQAQIIEKVRCAYTEAGINYSIDCFEGRHAGLILAETEFEPGAVASPSPVPAFALRDVTDVPFFTGGYLASVGEAEFRRALGEHLGAA